MITQTCARLTILLYTIHYTDVCMCCCYINGYTLNKHDDNDIICCGLATLGTICDIAY